MNAFLAGSPGLSFVMSQLVAVDSLVTAVYPTGQDSDDQSQLLNLSRKPFGFWGAGAKRASN